jgi:hypothetical protein
MGSMENKKDNPPERKKITYIKIYLQVNKVHFLDMNKRTQAWNLDHVQKV